MIKHRVERYGPYLAAAGAALGFLLFALAGVYTFRQQELVNERLCMQTVENRAATRATWDAARSLLISRSDNFEGIRSTNEFFNAILDTIPPLRCEGAKPVEIK